ncbi:MAG: SH3 domain-containing protein [Anaerolineae bacterium]|nr:SH3 domain-containing protein [Anaerolineae bacterium]
MHPRRMVLICAFIVTILLLLAGGMAMPVQSGELRRSAATPTVDIAAQVGALMQEQAVAIDASAYRVAGPISGIIFDNKTTPRTPAYTLLADCIAGVTFLKSQDLSAKTWIYALFFRLANDRGYAVSISSEQEWGFWQVQGTKFTQLDSGAISQFFEVANTLFVQVKGSTGRLFVNGVEVAQLDLSAIQSLGDVAVGIIPQRRSETDLALTTMIVWQGTGKAVGGSDKGGSDAGDAGGKEGVGIFGGGGNTKSGIVFGPENGKLQVSDGVFQPKNISVANFVLKVRLYNPYAASRAQFGFAVAMRRQSNGEAFYLLFTSEKRWTFARATTAGKLETIDSGRLSKLTTTSRGYNDLELHAAGDAGEFYLNGTLIAELDLSEYPDAGAMLLMAFSNDTDFPDNASARFEDLTITATGGGGGKAQVGPFCTVTVRTRSNFREAPTTSADLIVIIPAETELEVFGQNENGQWLLVEYDGDRGWVRTSTVDGADSCGDLPVEE